MQIDKCKMCSTKSKSIYTQIKNREDKSNRYNANRGHVDIKKSNAFN